MPAKTRYLTVVLFGAMLVLVSCEEKKSEPYYAPKDPPHVTDHSGHNHVDVNAKPEQMQLPQASRERQTGGLMYAVPEGWTEEANMNAMLSGAYKTADGARITISNLSGIGGGELANLNRWRGQVGLPAVEKLSDQKSQQIEIDGQVATVYFLIGEQSKQSILVASIPAPKQKRTWFVKMTGEPSVINQHSAAFANFLKSMRFDRGGASAPSGGEQQSDSTSGEMNS